MLLEVKTKQMMRKDKEYMCQRKKCCSGGVEEGAEKQMNKIIII